MRKRLSQALIHELLDYKPSSGQLFWRWRARSWFRDQRSFRTWNAKWAGRQAFTACKSRYHYPCGNLLGAVYEAHRIIWVWMTGEWPEEIDHINHNRSDNRWRNLRSVSRRINRRNHSQRKDNTSGVTGVCKSFDQWEASLSVNGECVYRKRFKSFRQAVAARKAAEKRFGFHRNHGKPTVVAVAAH